MARDHCNGHMANCHGHMANALPGRHDLLRVVMCVPVPWGLVMERGDPLQLLQATESAQQCRGTIPAAASITSN